MRPVVTHAKGRSVNAACVIADRARSDRGSATFFVHLRGIIETGTKRLLTVAPRTNFAEVPPKGHIRVYVREYGDKRAKNDAVIDPGACTFGGTGSAR